MVLEQRNVSLPLFKCSPTKRNLDLFSSTSPPSTATTEECKSEKRSVYYNLIVSFMNSEAFNNQTLFSPCSADANTQTAKCSFNVKFKTANYIPLCHSSPYHVFIFQLHFGSKSLPVCTGVLSVTLSAATLTDSKQRGLARSRLKASTPHITNGRYVSHLRKSGLMSLQSSQQPQKIMLLLKMTCKNTAKNNVWSQLSVVVSMMGML